MPLISYGKNIPSKMQAIRQSCPAFAGFGTRESNAPYDFGPMAGRGSVMTWKTSGRMRLYGVHFVFRRCMEKPASKRKLKVCPCAGWGREFILCPVLNATWYKQSRQESRKLYADDDFCY
jgi:hypothetical protein